MPHFSQVHNNYYTQQYIGPPRTPVNETRGGGGGGGGQRVQPFLGVEDFASPTGLSTIW